MRPSVLPRKAKSPATRGVRVPYGPYGAAQLSGLGLAKRVRRVMGVEPGHVLHPCTPARLPEQVEVAGVVLGYERGLDQGIDRATALREIVGR